MAKKTPRQPALFNPKLVCALSLLFTPIFGAALQARNWTELGKTHEAAASRFWVRSTVWLLILFVVVQTLFRNEEIMSWFGPYFLVVLWGAWMLTSGWKQLNYVAKNVGKFYEPRPIGKAITIGVAKKDVEKSPGVVIRVPKGSTEAIVEPLPPEAAQTDNAEKNTP